MLEFSGVFQQQDVAAGGGGGATPPTVVSITPTVVASGLSHAISLPATVTAGDLLMIFTSSDGGSLDYGSTTASGWTSGPIFVGTSTSHGAGSMFYKIAGGSEDGTTIDITTPSDEHLSAQCYRIQAWGGSASEIATSSANIDAANPFTPPTLTSGFGSVGTLWITAIALGSSLTLTASPGDYTVTETGDYGTATGTIITGYKTSVAASEAPGTFTFTAGSATRTGLTVAIRGV